MAMRSKDQINLPSLGAGDAARWFSSILESSCASLDASSGWIQVLDDDGAFSLMASLNCTGSPSPEDLDHGLCRSAVEMGACRTAHAAETDAILSVFEKAQGLVSILCVPLAGSKGIVGVLAFGRESKALFTPDDLNKAMLVSIPTSAFLEGLAINSSLEEKIALQTEGLSRADEEIVEMREQLVKSEKIAALGRLAAGLAHELNNPLSAILSNIQTFPEPGQAERVQRRLAMLETAVLRCTDIVEKLLNYSRQSDHNHAMTVKAAVEDTVELLDTQLKKDGVQVELNLPETEPVFCNPSELSQVLTNLILNARDAVVATGDPSRYRISVSASLSLGEDGRSFVLIEIADQGTGMPPEIQERIMEPFFSTKEIGKGTGLGLWVCSEIVRKHGGEIKLESALGSGSVFTVSLPVFSGPSDDVEAREEQSIPLDP
jgi:signal transduction histidine kinase